MDKQNVTLSLPKDILQKIKVIAAKRGASISSLLTDLMSDLVSEDEEYQAAQRSHLRLLQDGLALGTNGKIEAGRDELHERRN